MVVDCLTTRLFVDPVVFGVVTILTDYNASKLACQDIVVRVIGKTMAAALCNIGSPIGECFATLSGEPIGTVGIGCCSTINDFCFAVIIIVIRIRACSPENRGLSPVLLLDPAKYPSEEIAKAYLKRWDVETFRRRWGWISCVVNHLV